MDEIRGHFGERRTIKDRQGYLQDIAVQKLHFPLDGIDQNERFLQKPACLNEENHDHPLDLGVVSYKVHFKDHPT